MLENTHSTQFNLFFVEKKKEKKYIQYAWEILG